MLKEIRSKLEESIHLIMFHLTDPIKLFSKIPWNSSWLSFKLETPSSSEKNGN